MPIYEYKCTACQGTREVKKDLGDDTIPVCCEQSMQRIWAAVPVKFNTTGFYSTDN